MFYNTFFDLLLSKVHNFSMLRAKIGVSKGFEKLFRNFFICICRKKILILQRKS